jgi:hypothetical protein
VIFEHFVRLTERRLLSNAIFDVQLDHIREIGLWWENFSIAEQAVAFLGLRFFTKDAQLI